MPSNPFLTSLSARLVAKLSIGFAQMAIGAQQLKTVSGEAKAFDLAEECYSSEGPSVFAPAAVDVVDLKNDGVAFPADRATPSVLRNDFGPKSLAELQIRPGSSLGVCAPIPLLIIQVVSARPFTVLWCAFAARARACAGFLACPIALGLAVEMELARLSVICRLPIATRDGAGLSLPPRSVQIKVVLARLSPFGRRARAVLGRASGKLVVHLADLLLGRWGAAPLDVPASQGHSLARIIPQAV